MKLLTQHGVKVSRPVKLTREQAVLNFGEEYVRLAGVSQQYTRDPVMVIGDHVIENTMGSLYRRADILGLTSLLLGRVPPSGASWVSMPAADYSAMLAGGQFDKGKCAAIEGGDVIVLGKKVFVGNSRNAATGSSEPGYRWLKSYLKPHGYDVELVRLAEDILHLDVALSAPRFWIACGVSRGLFGWSSGVLQWMGPHRSNAGSGSQPRNEWIADRPGYVHSRIQ